VFLKFKVLEQAGWLGEIAADQGPFLRPEVLEFWNKARQMGCVQVSEIAVLRPQPGSQLNFRIAEPTTRMGSPLVGAMLSDELPIDRRTIAVP
jgi:hypothetical protein